MVPASGRMLETEAPTSWSGVVIDADRGYILTTDRPTDGASQLVVTFADGAERLTTEVRHDPRSDLTLLVIDVKGLRLQQANWGDPNKLEAGDWLIALGQPGVGPPTMSVGVFSARRRGVGEELIETDAEIPRVGAGGALVNLVGDLVGIGKLGGRRNDGFEGMSHAIPSDRARRVAADLAQFGRVRRGYLGVQVDPASAGRRDHKPGVRVSTVGPSSPAAEAGIRPGDLIVTANGRPLDGVGALQLALEVAPYGQAMTMTLERDGKSIDVTVRPRTLTGPAVPARPDPSAEAPPRAAPGPLPGSDRPRVVLSTPERPATPESQPPPDAEPPRPEGPAAAPPSYPGAQSAPPGR
jgi:S1-C subfamily serine protease